MRYGIALLVALMLIGLGASYVWGTARWLQQKRAALPDPNQFEEVGMEVTEIEMTRISLSNFLARFSPVLIPLIIGTSLYVASRCALRQTSNMD